MRCQHQQHSHHRWDEAAQSLLHLLRYRAEARVVNRGDGQHGDQPTASGHVMRMLQVPELKAAMGM